ncbi:MAG: hypothetical protein PHD36_08710 [Desulfotomaculaceae bacterium]|nr:hypothetical protein [Desulfotomaculaceae bacterium]
MKLKTVVSGDMALVFLGEDIPAVGPRFKSKEAAVEVARQYLEKISELSKEDQNAAFQIVLSRKTNGLYSLVIGGPSQVVGRLNNLDELLVKRFRRGLNRKLFILTCFVDGVEGQECLVLTEGLGAVFYAPGTIIG